MPSPRVREFCDARVPSVRINKTELRTNFMALKSLGVTAETLECEIDRFLQSIPDFDESSSKPIYHPSDCGTANNTLNSDLRFSEKDLFARGITHQTKILLRPCLEKYKAVFQGQESSTSFVLWGQEVIAKKAIEDAESKMVSLETKLSELERSGTALREAFQVEKGDRVPTSSPLVILVRLLVCGKSFQEKLRSEGVETVFANICEILALPGSLGKEEEPRKRKRLSNGAPRMLFVCRCQLPTGGHKMIVSASQENWDSLLAIKMIRRSDRDHRLGDYKGLVDKAWKRFCRRVAVESGRSHATGKDLKYETWRLAIKQMREDDLFLDRTKVLGQAFDARGERLPCVSCQGMFGFRTAKNWSFEEEFNEIIRFEPKFRSGYAHSCAEADASAQIFDLETQ
ncbi:hypothetical protein FQN54_006007 [Arachnomyces sp. PD_36]|nr:hypothetical protein FQN54_006007 [Arachnomyces sp. PD_36]